MLKGKKRYRTLILLGGPGCGKGTVSKLLEGEFPIRHISLGDILRKERLKDCESGRLIEEYLTEYEKTCKTMTKDVIELAFVLLKEEMLRLDQECLILDGFIKDWEMYRVWESEIKGISKGYRFVYLEAKENTMRERVVKRLKRGDEEIIDRRLNFFKENSIPMIERVKQLEGLSIINAEDDIDKVYSLLKTVYTDFMINSF